MIYKVTEQDKLIEVWYDRSLRLWTAIRVDENGYQMSDAIYDIDKALAVRWAGEANTYFTTGETIEY